MKRRPRKGFGENGFESRGGYMAAKKAKLAEQFVDKAAQETLEPNTNTGIFHGIAIFINGYTVPSADQLKRIMAVHGGMFHHYMTENTTHIIATNLPNVKIKRLRVMRVVKPEWITDSVEAGKLLDFRNYLLYSHQSITQPRLQFGESNTDISTSITNETCSVVCAGPCSNAEVTDKRDVGLLSDKQEIEGEVSTSGSSTGGQKLPWNVRSAGETGFLSEFYSNSRLHHLSTMGATFKQYVNQLREKSNQKFDGQERLEAWVKQRKEIIDFAQSDEIEDDLPTFIQNSKQVIMHIDMDCFFVSVGLRNHPELRGKPVAVTHAKANQGNSKARAGVDRKAEFELYNLRHHGKDKNHPELESDRSMSRVRGIDETSSMSEIASCSYEARKAGLKNGMFLGSALKLCPDLATIPYDFEGYKEVSYTLYNTLAEYTLDIEAVSCDEMFVDCTSLLRKTQAHPLDLATFIRQEIKVRTGCPASTGFGSNMLQARLANKRAKPDGQFYLTPEAVFEFMKDIKVADLPGVGRSLSHKLQDLGAHTCEDLQRLSLASLQKELGSKTGETLHHHCRGEDHRKLTYDHVRKSVSAEVNYGIRFTNQPEADKFLTELSTEVSNRLKEVNMRGRCITLKLMVRAKDAPIESAKFMGHGFCDHLTKSTSVPRPVSKPDEIAWVVLAISRQLRVPPSELRGIGIQVSRLEKDCRTAGGLTNFLKRGPTATIIDQPCGSKPPVESVEKPVSTKSFGGLNNYLVKGDRFVKKEEPMGQICGEVHSSNANAENEGNEPDPDFLAALPEDIREEVILTYSRKNVKHENKAEVQSQDISIATNQPGTSTNWKHLNQNIRFTQIEPSFLAALPEELRTELETELSRKVCDSTLQTKDSAINMISTDLRNDPTRIVPSNLPVVESCHAEEHVDVFNTVNEESSSLSVDLSLSETRALIKAWVGSELQPQPCDVEMLSKHCQQLVASRDIYSLDLLLKCLHRCITAKKCTEWQEAFHTIVNKAQDTMKTVYGSKLKVNMLFT